MLTLSIILSLVVAAATAGQTYPSPPRLWTATDDFNGSAATPMIVMPQGVAIVATNGPQIMGKNINTPSNGGFPDLADWTVTLSGPPMTLFQITDTAVAVVTANTVGAYRYDGLPLWNFTNTSCQFAPAANGQVFTALVLKDANMIIVGATVGEDGGAIVAINITSGEPYWVSSCVGSCLSQQSFMPFTAGSTKGGYVFTTSYSNNAVTAFDQMTGKQIWQTALNTSGYMTTAIPVASGSHSSRARKTHLNNHPAGQSTAITGWVLVGYSGEPTFDAFDAATGKLVQHLTMKGDATSLPPVLSANGNTLYLFTTKYLSAVSVPTTQQSIHAAHRHVGTGKVSAVLAPPPAPKAWATLWDHTLNNAIASYLLDELVTGAIYVAGYDTADRVDLKTGKPTNVFGGHGSEGDYSCIGGMALVSSVPGTTPTHLLVSCGDTFMVEMSTKNVRWIFEDAQATGPMVYVPPAPTASAKTSSTVTSFYGGLLIIPNAFAVPGWPTAALSAVSVQPPASTVSYEAQTLMTPYSILLPPDAPTYAFAFDTNNFYSMSYALPEPSMNWSLPYPLTLGAMQIGPGIVFVAPGVIFGTAQFTVTGVNAFTGEAVTEVPIGASNGMIMKTWGVNISASGHATSFPFALYANDDQAVVLDGRGLLKQQMGGSSTGSVKTSYPHYVYMVADITNWLDKTIIYLQPICYALGSTTCGTAGASLEQLSHWWSKELDLTAEESSAVRRHVAQEDSEVEKVHQAAIWHARRTNPYLPEHLRVPTQTGQPNADSGHEYTLLLHGGGESALWYVAVEATNITEPNRWAYNWSNNDVTCPPIPVGTNMIVTGADDYHVYAFHRETGALLWKSALPGIKNMNYPPYHAVWIPAQGLYVLTAEAIFKLNRVTGKIEWRSFIAGAPADEPLPGGELNSHPHIGYKGQMMLVRNSACLYAFNLTEKGNLTWWHAPPGDPAPTFGSTASVANQRVFFTPLGSTVTGFDIQTGAILMQVDEVGQIGEALVAPGPPTGTSVPATPILVFSDVPTDVGDNAVYFVSIPPAVLQL